MKTCWSVQLLAAPDRATLTATATLTAGMHFTPLNYNTMMELVQTTVLGPFFVCVHISASKTSYSCMQNSKCVSPHQYCVDLHGQQYVLVIFMFFSSFITEVFLVVPSLLRKSCPRATISSISLSPGASTSKGVPMTECWGGLSEKYKHKSWCVFVASFFFFAF